MIMGAFKKILTPVDYIRIEHPEKRVFDIYIPLIASLAIAAFIFSLDKPVPIIAKDGLISVINGILQILSGFYIASMAAVATFQKSGMDSIMDGTPPTLKGKDLTRRKFLTYLFGYLAFASIIMYLIGGGLQLLSPTLSSAQWAKICWVKISFVVIYLFIIANIICTTILGMYFMIDKMHDEKPKLNSEHKDL
ncbi:hypothetical protein [Klebsiella pneumoniae]|uniref:hypothetical protein n=1 Tax=Klebsiella pneumoniae TaxID=573 RepID=UPI0020A6EBC4|nr:hypothetical protein [Klebsiella pneumoniae]MCP3187572.1 hypothetical protein [Klebsiella pneumoniae]